jgi:hypothetical protein
MRNMSADQGVNRSRRFMSPTPRGIRALAAFFVFGACMSLFACIGLLFPGGALEPMWSFNPQSHEALLRMGSWAVALMGTVSIACALSASGLLTRSGWGYRLALAVLAVNLVGDAANAIFGHDPRTLIGLPIGGALIAYLLRPQIRVLFGGVPNA